MYLDSFKYLIAKNETKKYANWFVILVDYCVNDLFLIIKIEI